MSAFVLSPPPSVRVVSFFITARFAGQADRVAFSDVVLEQLLELLGEPRPTFLTEATRDAHLLGTLSRAADFCHSNGERLVLVIDGLDEDQGATAGSDAHSIAALLPINPPAEMRIIVASRLNPSVPTDVPEGHPLRDSAVVRLLSRSPRAEVVRHDAERELKQLLRGPSSDQDLLGLVTAAGGGLSGDDLSELTGLPVWEVEDHLGAVTGRMFVPRTGVWQPETKVYVLAHEDLQQEATRLLGTRRLFDYRAVLHTWADSYQARRWPTNTPDYLFRGYFRLLQVTGELSRMLACATDPFRHDRMLDLIGGDTSALAEITATQETFLQRENFDVIAMSRLAVHRASLERRNESIPGNLPGVWAQLGRVSRAEALARSIMNASRQIRALVPVIRQVADAGDRRLAKILSAQADRLLVLIEDPYEMGLALALVARSYADAGDPQQANRLLHRGGTVAESLRGSAQQATLTAALARGWAAAGEIRMALDLAGGITSWSERAQALVGIVIEVSRWGYFETAQQIAASIRGHVFASQAAATIAKKMASVGELPAAMKPALEAQSRAQSVRDPRMQAWALVLAADALTAVCLLEPALALLSRAESLAKSIPRDSHRHDTLVIVARSLAAATGSPDRAAKLVRGIANPRRRVKGLAAVASGLATAGAQDLAKTYATESESAARSIVVPGNHSRPLAALSQASAAVGNLPQAERIARSIADAGQRDRALTVVVQAVAVARDLDRAMEISKSITDAQQWAKAAALVVKAAVHLGQFERAAEIAVSIEDDDQRNKAVSALRNAQHDVGASARHSAPRSASASSPASGAIPDTAGDEADNLTAAAIIAAHPKIYPQAVALTALARKLAASGNLPRALEAANLVDNMQLRAKAYVEVANVVKIRNPARAEEIIDRAIKATKTIVDPQRRDRILGTIAGWMVGHGDVDRAELIAQAIQTAEPRTKALISVARAAAARDLHARAESIVDLIEQPHERANAYLAIVDSGSRRGHSVWAEQIARSIPSLAVRGRALTVVAQRVAAAGDLPRAENIARSLAGYSGQAHLFVTLAADSSAEDSRRLVAQALTIGDWQICLPVILRIEPRAIEAIAEEITRSDE